MTLSAATDTRSYTGTIKPRYESDLGFRVAGKIVERLVNIGDRVTPGMTLARLDASDYRLSLESAEAELKAAQSSLKQTEADEKRYAALNEKKWVSDASYEQKKATADEARGRVERATRALALAKNQLAYTDLVATEAGVITALPVEVGQVVSAGQLIARVARLDELEAVVSIPESRIDGDRNAAATVTLWADADRVYDSEAARNLASGRPSDAHLSGPLFAHEAGCRHRARQDRDGASRVAGRRRARQAPSRGRLQGSRPAIRMAHR